MKSLLLSIFLGVSIMAQEIVPYPFPNYDEDLIAKEIVNGSYMASIKMLIRNSQTGAERYVYVPDTPKVIRDAEKALDNGNPRPERYDQNMSIYDRDKMLEDAVLPKMVDVGEKLPEFVSKSMCPQGVELIATQANSYLAVTTMGRGDNTVFVGIEKTDDGDSAVNTNNDVYTFFRHNGDTKTKMFDFEEETTNEYVRWAYSTGGRSFFAGAIKMYEFTEFGYTILNNSKSTNAKFVIRDGDDYYTIVSGAVTKAVNIDTGEELPLDSGESISTSSVFTVSVKGDSFATASNYYYIKDGEFKKGTSKNRRFFADKKVRFDYHDGNYPTGYNLKNGVPNHPKARAPSSSVEHIGLRDIFVTVGDDDNIYYTKDYQIFEDTGIKSSRNAKIVITKDFFYFQSTNKTVILKPTEWAYERPPRAEYAELYAKEKMLNSQHEEPYLDY